MVILTKAKLGLGVVLYQPGKEIKELFSKLGN